MAFAQLPSMADPQSTRNSAAPIESQAQSAFFSQRSQRQLGLFAAGAGFFALSSLITRRSIVRRYKASIPKFYQPSNQHHYNVNGAVEALEALNLATINVLSVGMMMGGGAMWAFDITSLDDMRKKVRTNLGVDPIRTDQDAEQEIEEWFASVLARKEFKALRGDFEAKKEAKDKGTEAAREGEKKR